MPVTFRCLHCGAEDLVSDAMVGRRIRCPECEEFGEVASAADPPAAGLTAVAGAASPPRTPSLEAPSAAMPSAAMPSATMPSAAMASAAPPPRPESPPAFDDQEGGPPEDGGGMTSVKFNEDPERTTEGDMDMTPMVDVTFLLLIFFMVTAAFTMQKSIPIPKPDQTDEPSTVVRDEQEETPDIVTVQIDEIGTFVVMTADWEKEAPGEIDLLARLREARQGGAAGVIPDTLMIKAHSEALHGRVVMALDSGTATGFEKQQVMTVDDDF